MLRLYPVLVLHRKRKLHKERRTYAPVPISSSSNARWASTILCPPSPKNVIIWLGYVQFAMWNHTNAALTKRSPYSIDSMVNFLSLMEISAPSTYFPPRTRIFNPSKHFSFHQRVKVILLTQSQPLTIWAYSSCINHDLKMSKNHPQCIGFS